MKPANCANCIDFADYKRDLNAPLEKSDPFVIKAKTRNKTSPRGRNARTETTISFPEDPHCADAEGEKRNNNNTNTTMHQKYATKPIARPTLVFGRDVSTLTAEDCLALIGDYSKEAKQLAEGPAAESAYVTNRVASLKAAVAALTARLDTFKDDVKLDEA